MEYGIGKLRKTRIYERKKIFKIGPLQPSKSRKQKFRNSNFATAKTKGVTANIVREFENVGERGGGSGDDCFSKADI